MPGTGLTENDLSAKLLRWTRAMVAVGIFLRLFRYTLALALNGDEAALGLNIINRGYAGLLRPLDYMQVAPVGFLWAQHAVYQCLGMSEYAMRLLPTLAGIAALALFALWARLIAPPLAAFIATGIVAVGLFIVEHGVEIKPYGFDLLASLVLLLPTTLFLMRGSTRWLVWLIALTPLAICMSYPSAFIAASAALALTLSFKKMRRLDRSLVLLYLLVLAGSFFLLDYKIGTGQHRQAMPLMGIYWKDAFPPANPIQFLLWLIVIHAGPLMAYPLGGKHLLSLPNFLLFIIGLLVLLRKKNIPVTALLLAPFGWTFLAAALRLYPYGQSERVSQHLVPSIVMLIALGIAALIERFVRTPLRRRLAARLCLAALIALALHVLILNILHLGTSQQIAARQMAQSIVHDARGGTIVVVTPRIDTPVNGQWYLRSLDNHIVFNAMQDSSWRNARGRICVVTSNDRSDMEQLLQAWPKRTLEEHQDWTIEPFGPPDHWQIFIFAPARER